MRRAAQCLLVLCFGLSLWAQPALKGRWLFEGLSDSGKRVPLFIIEFSGEETPEAKLLSSSAPFELVLKDVKVEADTLTLVFLADKSQLTLAGTIGQGSIKGKAAGETLRGLTFRAEPTEQTKLKTIAQPSGQELEDYQSARQSENPSGRIGQLRAFLEKYPESPLKTAALSDIVDSSLEADVKDGEILKLIEETVESSTDKAVVMNDLAYSLAEQGKLLDKAEELAKRAVSNVEPGTGAHATFLDTLGWVLYRGGKLDQAIEKLQEAVEISPRRAQSAVHLAEVLAAGKRQAEAAEAYVQAFVSGNRPAGAKAEELYRQSHGSLDGFHDLIDRAYAKQPPLFDAGRFEGEYSGAGAVAELFTGAQCGPCQAADYGFDGLLQHFPEQVLTVLEYHLHIPGPDPLTNPDSVARARFYQIRSTPIAVFSGIQKRSGGGPTNRAEMAFREYLPVVTEQSTRQTTVGIELKVTAAGDQLNVVGNLTNAPVSSAGEPTGKIDLRLFLALVEKTVHYTGANGVHLHRNVVRKFLNGVEGTPVTEKELRFKYHSSLAGIEAALKQYLDGLTKEWNVTFDGAPLVLNRKELAVAAFVQDVQSGEILASKVVSAR